jgi:hypothetical protein
MKRAEPGWFLLALAGLAAVLGSFLPFYTFAGDVNVTVWSRGLFPTATLIPLLGFAIGLEALFVLIRGHEPRSPFLNFTWEQVRLAVGAFMILLALSYIVQDRAGGTLGLGYLVLSLSALATFAGGVMTRRAELARAPGEQPAEREARPVFRPAIATVNRVGSEFGKNVAGFGHSVRARLRERSEAKAAAKAAAAAAAAKAAAATTAANAAAKEKADVAAEDAAASVEAPEAPAMQPPPPTKTFDVPAAELPSAAEQADVAPAEPPPAAEEPVKEPTAEEVALPAEEPTAEEVALPAEEPTAEEVAKAVTEPAVEKAPKPAEEPAAVEDLDEPTADMPVEGPPVEEPATKVVEEPAKSSEESEKPTRAAPLSAVAQEPDPDATPTPDGKTSEAVSAGEKTVESKPTAVGKTSGKEKPPGPPPPEAEKGETEKERADTGTES